MKHFTFLKHSPTKESTMFTVWSTTDRKLNRGCKRAVINIWQCFQYHTVCNKYTTFCTKEVLWFFMLVCCEMKNETLWHSINTYTNMDLELKYTITSDMRNNFNTNYFRYQWYIMHYNCPTLFMQYAKNFKFLQLNDKKVNCKIHTVPFIS